jgi:hypothetical protein
VGEPPVYHLERFYFGNLLLPDHRPSARPGLIACTPGVTPETVAGWLRTAPLLPPPPAETTPEMPGALGLLKSAAGEFALVKAQRNEAGQPQILYVLMPREALASVGGNVLAFRSVALMAMPAFTEVRTDLQPFALRYAAPLTADAQSEALNALLVFCHDSFQAVEGLLAGLIEGQPLAIVRSPLSVELRLRFLGGMLALLPASMRTDITFATQVSDATLIRADVKFVTAHASPAGHLVYDWESGELLNPAPSNAYARYIVTQLRLDPSLVVEQSEQLADTATWRMQRTSDLSNALSWVARRAAFDQVVREGQPADHTVVAEVLREDPTLTDDLRQIYARHLLAFALALEQPAAADILPGICAEHPSLADAVSRQLLDAVRGGQAGIVYTILERWLLRASEAARQYWRPILHQAAHAHARDLAAHGAADQMISFLDRLQKAPAALAITDTIPDVIGDTLGAARRNPRLAEGVFLLAARELPIGHFCRLLLDQGLTSQLPPATQAAITHLGPQPAYPLRRRILNEGARPFGDNHRMLVLARLVEGAVYLQRVELIDTPALLALVAMTQSPQAADYTALVHQVVRELSEESRLQALEPPGPRVLVQLLLQTQAYYDAVELLAFYQERIFGSGRLNEFTSLVGELFQHLSLSPDALSAALSYLEGSRLGPEARAMIYVGALASRRWEEDQEHAAYRLTTMIFSDHRLIDVIGTDNVLQLLSYFARHHRTSDALHVGASLIDHTLNSGLEGAELVAHIWPTITWDEEATVAARALLRRYIRGVPQRDLPEIVDHLERALGKSAGEIMRATWLLRVAMGGSDLGELAEHVQAAARLLTDIGAVYHSGKELPPLHRLRRELDTLTGGLSEYERDTVADNFLAIARLVYTLGGASSNRRRATPDDVLVEGRASPRNGLDLLFFIGGFLTRGTLLPLELQRAEMAHLFGSRSAAILLRQTTAARRLLENLAAAFETPDAVVCGPQALAAELANHWELLSPLQQRQLHGVLADECQHLAQIIRLMVRGASGRTLDDGGVNRQLDAGRRQPQAALEALRWIHGYFARKHV